MLSAFSALETSIVIEVRKGENGSLALAQLLYRAKIEIVEMNEQQVQLALEAWRKFGKGTTQPNLILVIVVRMPWQKTPVNHCYSRVMISVKLI